MEAIGTLCRRLSGCKGTDNNRADQIKFVFFLQNGPLHGYVYCPLYDVFRNNDCPQPTRSLCSSTLNLCSAL